MTSDLELLLRAWRGDRGCDVTMDSLAAYVEFELGGEAPTRVYPLTAMHLECCAECRADHDGLLEAASRFGHATPE